MKKLIMVIVLGMFLSGCGTAAKESEFWSQGTNYKSWSHLGFSWTGFKNVTKEDADKSAAEKWWGISYARH